MILEGRNFICHFIFQNQNLDGNVKNGREAMDAIFKAKELEGEALEKYKKDLIEYCALDTYAIVKFLKKLYEAI